MQHITLEEVKAACRREYAAKNLLFQNWRGVYGYGGHRTKGHPCAIGAALTADTLREIDLGNLHGTILATEDWDASRHLKSIIDYDDEELLALAEIQQYHDKLCKLDQRTITWKESLAQFLAAIAA